MDGYRLYEYLKDPAHHAYDGTAIPPVQHSEVDTLAARFQSWFERLFLQPQEAAPDAWRPSYLEYQFSLSTSNPGRGEEDAVLVADEYYHGRLDWYNVHEEEVPRAGIIVRQSFQRTRWYDGRVITWFGVRKQSGRGEGNSNLRFDQLTPVKSSPANG